MQIQTKQTISKTEFLGNLISLEYGSGLTSSNRKGSNYPVFGSNGIIGYHDQYLIKGPGVIVGRKGSIGEVTWSDMDFWPIDTTYYVKLKNENISLKWIYYLLSQKNLKDFNSATGIPGLNRNDVYKVTCYSPSFKEQQKIASVLSNVDELMQKTEQIIEQTYRLKKGLMQKLLTKGIGHSKFRKTEFGDIPEEWTIKKLFDVGKIIGGGTPDTTNKEYWENGNISWAVPTDLTDLKTNYIDRTEKNITEKGLSNSSAKLLPIGTVLITSRATIGECAITTKPITTNQGFQSIVCNPQNDNKFILYFIEFNKEKLIRKSHGTTFLEISKNNIKNLKLPIPSLKEQQKIASVLSNVDELMQKQREYRSKIECLKKGLMQQLLTGKIRVKV